MNLHAATPIIKDSFRPGTPVPAPLLFPNLAVLGSLGIMGVMRVINDTAMEKPQDQEFAVDPV